LTDTAARRPLAAAPGSVLFGNEAASLWDIGDGVACLEIHTKLNAVTPPVLDVLAETLARGGADFEALVIGNDDPRAFSAGGDLAHMHDVIAAGRFSALEAYIARGQGLMLAIKRAGFPVVAAVHGLALGGGWEICLHADAIVAHAGLRAGLPEAKVGLVPAWGGCTQSLLRGQAGAAPSAAHEMVFADLCRGHPAVSAEEARARGYLRARDRIVADRALLLPEAKRVALALREGYVPPEPAPIRVGGREAAGALMASVSAQAATGGLTQTDLAIFEALATILTGGPDARSEDVMAEEAMMRLELDAIAQLARRPENLARIAHMLVSGKPLSN